jgi:hypothetical protein
MISRQSRAGSVSCLFATVALFAALLVGCQPAPTEPTTGNNNAPKGGANAGIPANMQAPAAPGAPGAPPPKPAGAR